MQAEIVKLTKSLEERILRIGTEYSNLIFLCVGTNGVVGDSIGPMIGSKIKQFENDYLKVYGTLDDTLNFSNAKNIIEKVYEFYSKPYLVTIDAALSNRTRFGDIIVGSGFIKIGKALEKSICFYSDVTIKCVVGKCYIDKEKNLQELKRLSASKSNKIANDVSTSIKNVLEKTKIYV